MLQRIESKASARDAERKPQSSKKRISVDIKDGEVSVAEPLPAGVSLRIELILEEPEAGRAFASTIPKSELRERSGVARGSSPLPVLGEARGEPTPAAEPEAAGAADGDDEVDFDEKPTFELDKSELESLARGASLPLSPPPASPRAGNDIPPISGSTESVRTIEAPLAKLDEANDEHAGEARTAVTRGNFSEPSWAKASEPTWVAQDARTRRGTGSAIDAQRRERAIVVSLIVALVAALAAIAALLLR
jgi:hypothetical protein